ncbi:hypothetical protein XFF4834R_chr19110 [Xanthomonas citri pv. fuscans]|nr:hypothetical protein XFF4834R_chr19110 [Xanthomonas citri pv. fuscans]
MQYGHASHCAAAKRMQIRRHHTASVRRCVDLRNAAQISHISTRRTDLIAARSAVRVRGAAT